MSGTLEEPGSACSSLQQQEGLQPCCQTACSMASNGVDNKVPEHRFLWCEGNHTILCDFLPV